jgi:hypothetical protein
MIAGVAIDIRIGQFADSPNLEATATQPLDIFVSRLDFRYSRTPPAGTRI